MIEAERGSWVLVDGRWIPKAQYARAVQRSIEAQRLRSDLPSPQIMRDIEPFRNVAVDGGVISSRSERREMIKRHGLVELGNDFKPIRRRPKKLPPVKDSIKRTLQELGA